MNISKALLLLRKFQSFMRHHKNNSIVIDNVVYKYDNVFDDSISAAISALEEKKFRDRDPMFRNIYKLIDFCHIETKMNSDFIPIDDECINDIMDIVKYCDANKLPQPILSCWSGGSGLQATWDIPINNDGRYIMHIVVDTYVNKEKKDLSMLISVDDESHSTMTYENTNQLCNMLKILWNSNINERDKNNENSI